MPNYYGYGLGARAIEGRDGLADFERFVRDVEGTPGVDYVALVCGFWYEFSLAMGEPWLGFRIRNRTVRSIIVNKRRRGEICVFCVLV
jgi:hypothetical protein